MSHNALFNFIKTHTMSPVTFLGKGVRIVLDNNKEGRPYFRLHLEPAAESVLYDDKHTYTLREHHISVYETEHRSIPELSQYHYTAYFQDNEGAQYQLHVYFNCIDEVVTEPVFSKIDAAGNFIYVPADFFHDQFIDLATVTSKPIIGLLRKQLDIKVQELLLRCNTLELEACELSQPINGHYDAYVTKLEELCVALQNVMPLVKYDHHEKKERLIQQMIVGLKHQSITRPDTTEVDVGSTIEERDASMIPAREIIEAPKLIMLDDRIEILSGRFEQLNKDDDALYAKELRGVLAMVYEFSLLLGESGTSASPLALNKLQRLHRDVHSTCEKLYTRLLLNEKTAALKELPSFHYLLTDKYLTYALQTRKPLLLDFVLTHGDFVINDHSVIIRGKVYPSAVHYCFECDANATPMSECLSVLMKHNASIVVNDQRGLPIAHSILSTVNHPLRKALSTPEVKSKSLYSISFYKQLISALNGYLSGPLLKTAKERVALEREIAIYRNELRILMLSLEGGSLQKARAELSDKYYANLYIDQIKREPEFIALNTALGIQIHDYLRKLSWKERNVYEHQCAAVLKDIDAFLDGMDISSLTYNDVKHSVCEHLLKSTEVCQKSDRLFDILQELKKAKINSRRAKKFENEANQLKRDISAIIREMTPQDYFAKARESTAELLEMIAKFEECCVDALHVQTSSEDGLLVEDMPAATEDICDSITTGGLRTLLGMFARPAPTTVAADDEHKSLSISVQKP